MGEAIHLLTNLLGRCPWDLRLGTCFGPMGIGFQDMGVLNIWMAKVIVQSRSLWRLRIGRWKRT